MILRPLEQNDAPQVARLVGELAGWNFPQDFLEKEARGYLAHTATMGETVVGLFDMRGPLLGRISLSEEHNEPGEWHIGYYLLREARKQGYMGEAILGLKGVFKRANATAFQASAEIKNRDSIRVLEKAGFRQSRPSDGTHLYFKMKL